MMNKKSVNTMNTDIIAKDRIGDCVISTVAVSIPKNLHTSYKTRLFYETCLFWDDSTSEVIGSYAYADAAYAGHQTAVKVVQALAKRESPITA
jgi:hypothetical protein